MDKELKAVVGPHSPLPFPHMRNENQPEVDPVPFDAIINAVIGLNPIAVHITGIRLLRTETAVDVDLLNPGWPKRFDGGAEPFQ